MEAMHTEQVSPDDDAADAAEEWTGYAMLRLNDTQVLLDDIGQVIETVEPARREHAADLLDAAIELLTRLRTRLPPGEARPPGPEPPF